MLSGGTRDGERLSIEDLGEGGHQSWVPVTRQQRFWLMRLFMHCCSEPFSLSILSSAQLGNFSYSLRYNGYTTLNLIVRVQHQLRSHFLVELLRRQESKGNRCLLQRSPLLVSLLRTLGHVCRISLSIVRIWKVSITHCHSQGGCSKSSQASETHATRCGFASHSPEYQQRSSW